MEESGMATKKKPEPKKKTTALVKKEKSAVVPAKQIDESIISSIVLRGDISGLSEGQKTKYNIELCKSLGLNPYTQPFQILKLQGKEVLYATKTATEQLRKVYGVSVTSLDRTISNDICIVTANVSDAQGRSDASTGAVNVAGLKGDMLANAIMKAETKAKRRATLSICGLGFLDETEIETIPGAHKTVVTEHKEESAEPMTIETACAEMRKADNMRDLISAAQRIKNAADWNNDDQAELLRVYKDVEKELLNY